MNITRYDAVVLLYNFAVVLSSGYLILSLNISDREAMIAIAFGLALVWTVYFKYGMFHRLADHPYFDTEEESNSSTD